MHVLHRRYKTVDFADFRLESNFFRKYEHWAFRAKALRDGLDAWLALPHRLYSYSSAFRTLAPNILTYSCVIPTMHKERLQNVILCPLFSFLSGPVYMEASYPVDRVTRFAGTNKRSVYMEPSYLALICSIHCSYISPGNL